MIPELCSWLKGVFGAKRIGSAGTGGACRTSVSQSLGPGGGGDSGLFQQTPWYNIKFPAAVFCFCKLSLVSAPQCLPG